MSWPTPVEKGQRISGVVSPWHRSVVASVGSAGPSQQNPAMNPLEDAAIE